MWPASRGGCVWQDWRNTGGERLDARAGAGSRQGTAALEAWFANALLPGVRPQLNVRGAWLPDATSHAWFTEELICLKKGEMRGQR